MSDLHTHPRTDELAVFWVPADTDIPMQYKIIDNHWQAMNRLVGGYCEAVRTDVLPELSCGCNMALIVNEEARLSGTLGHNIRASILYPDLLGDIFLTAEGLIQSLNSEDDLDVDLFSLPPEFNNWEGPGHPIPVARTIGD